MDQEIKVHIDVRIPEKLVRYMDKKAEKIQTGGRKMRSEAMRHWLKLGIEQDPDLDKYLLEKEK